MSVITLEEAQTNLPQVIADLKPGEEVVIAENGQALAVLTRSPRTSWPCRAGSARDIPHWMADDFNAPLEEFREYME